MTETAKPRLIDANALKARLIKYHDGFSAPYDAHTMGMMVAIRECIDRIESAPTVETTDDVLSSLETLEKEMTLNYSNGEYSFKVIGLGYTSYARLPIEAVTRLEASLNSK